MFIQGNGGWRTAPPISITMLSNLVVRYFRPRGSGPCPRSPRHCTDHAGRARQSGLLNRPGSRLLSRFQQASWRTVQGTLTATRPISLRLRDGLVDQGIARTQSPTNKNYAPELPTFGAIDGVSPTGVQWKGLVHGEPPYGSRYPLCQVSMLCQRSRAHCPGLLPAKLAGEMSSESAGHLVRARRSRGQCWSQRPTSAKSLSFSGRFPEQWLRPCPA